MALSLKELKDSLLALGGYDIEPKVTTLQDLKT